MSALKSLLIATLCATAAVAQISFPGSCPDQTVVDPFDIPIPRYFGKWYEIEAYVQNASAGGICISANYSAGENGTVTVFNSLFLVRNETYEYRSVTGRARQVDPTAAKLAVSFGVSPGEAPYWVLETDYINYAVVWSCRDQGTSNLQNAYFLSRSRDPSPQTRDYVHEIFTQRGIDQTNLQATRQNDCPPEPEPPAH